VKNLFHLERLMKATTKVIFWIVSVLFIIIGVIGILAWQQWQAVFFLLAGVSIVPTIINKINQNYNREKYYNVIACSTLVLMSLYITTISIPVFGNDTDREGYEVYITPAAGQVPLSGVMPVSAVPDELKVHFLDVGQADSTLLQLPNGETLLIDGGNSHNAVTILNYIQDLNIKTIDHLIITHPHADHIGGIPAIIEAMEIKNLYMTRTGHNTIYFERLMLSIDKKGLHISEAKIGVEILSDLDLQVVIVAPARNDYRDINDHSVVVKITYGVTSFLFAGDAGSSSKEHITADISADVLKVSNHGNSTATSDVCLKRIAPVHAVISVGENNSYGDPCDTVISRLNDADVNIHRTDLQGTIVFTSDGKNISVR